jgi:hypothetical protein
MKVFETSMAIKMRVSRNFLSKHKSKISKTSSSLGLVLDARLVRVSTKKEFEKVFKHKTSTLD